MAEKSELKISKLGKDDMADVVLERYRRAKEYRETHIVHQTLSAEDLIVRAEHQYRREYTTEEAAAIAEGFNMVDAPTRYMGIVQQKVNATFAWMNDLVVNNLDSMFTATPSPEPELDDASIKRIRNQVRDELRRRMAAANIADPRMLLDVRGEPAERIKGFLQEQIMSLKEVEQTRMVSLASKSAKKVQRRMRDSMIEGNFRQAYQAYNFDRALYGNGIIKFPDFRRLPVLKHAGRKVKMEWTTVPWFRHVQVKDFYPIADAIDYQTNTGNTEYTFVSKAELINKSRQKEYFTAEIEKIIHDFEYKSRNWLDSNEDMDFWNLDETIQLLIHEGFFTGDELRNYGIDGLDAMDYVSARVEVCGGRTIRCQLLTMPGGADRSYFGSAFNKIGDNLYDYLGMGAMLWDSEQRANRLMYMFEHNIDWASRPPIMKNPNVFENPNDSREIVPGRQYDIEDRFATSGSMPEPIRPMNAVSAQYHLIMTQVSAVLRQADEDCGIPAFAYGAQDFGRSSLGEYSQRMSNALRTIKQAALNEDIGFIEPVFKSLFRYELENDKDLAVGQDIGIVIRGMTGLLKEDQQIQRQQAVFGSIVQLGQQNIVSPQVVQYAARQMLEQAGFPVDALGMSNPELDNAFAVAAGQPLPGQTPGGAQVPTLDGRSGVPAQNVASSSGASQLSVPGPTV